MKERDIIKHIEDALVGRNASEVPFKELVDKLPKGDRAVDALIKLYREKMADVPLCALNILARRKERKERLRGAESVMPDLDETIIAPPGLGDEPND